MPTPRKKKVAVPEAKPVQPPPGKDKKESEFVYIKLELPKDNEAVKRFIEEAKRLATPLSTHARSVLLRIYADPVVTHQVVSVPQENLMPVSQSVKNEEEDGIPAPPGLVGDVDLFIGKNFSLDGI